MSIIRLTLLALVACVPLLAQAAPYQLTTAWPVNVGPLNPHLYTPNQMFAQSMVYEPLVKYQADGSVQPWLATRWRHSTDGKTWWFTLRDDVAFSNGEPFNAQAAAANFQAVLANRQRHAWLELANQITDVRALSATELQITLKSAYAPLLQELALPRPFRFIAPSQLQAIARCFDDPSTDIATLVKPFTEADGLDALENPNSPKVVLGSADQALYFSRSVIPYLRGVPREEWLARHTFYKHIGMYAFRRETLYKVTALPQSALERAESLEQLRWLENGFRIRAGISDVETIGIDTPEDLAKAEEFLKLKTKN